MPENDDQTFGKAFQELTSLCPGYGMTRARVAASPTLLGLRMVEDEARHGRLDTVSAAESALDCALHHAPIRPVYRRIVKRLLNVPPSELNYEERRQTIQSELGVGRNPRLKYERAAKEAFVSAIVRVQKTYCRAQETEESYERDSQAISEAMDSALDSRTISARIDVDELKVLLFDVLQDMPQVTPRALVDLIQLVPKGTTYISEFDLERSVPRWVEAIYVHAVPDRARHLSAEHMRILYETDSGGEFAVASDFDLAVRRGFEGGDSNMYQVAPRYFWKLGESIHLIAETIARHEEASSWDEVFPPRGSSDRTPTPVPA